MSSVGSATFLMAITGFSWAVTVWAPFSLVSILHFVHLWIVYLHSSAYQLAEAILSKPVAEDFDEIGSIRLADARTRAREEEQQQFLVGEEDDDADSDNVESRSASPDQVEETRLGPGMNNVMGNAGAQISTVDVHALNGDIHRIGEESGTNTDVERDAGGDENGSSGLAAKAGIILVSFLCYPQHSLAFLMRLWHDRAFTISLL